MTWTLKSGRHMPLSAEQCANIAEVWNLTMRQLFDARYPSTADEPPVAPLPPDYATTYRGFDERVRKIVAEMAPKARVITDRTHETEAQGAGMFYEFDFGHGVVKSGVMPFGSYESPEDIAIVLCLEAFEEIGRRGDAVTSAENVRRDMITALHMATRAAIQAREEHATYWLEEKIYSVEDMAKVPFRLRTETLETYDALLRKLSNAVEALR